MMGRLFHFPAQSRMTYEHIYHMGLEVLPMNDCRHDPETLRRDYDTALRLLDQRGLVRCMDPHWTAEAKRLFLSIIVVLPDVRSCTNRKELY